MSVGNDSDPAGLAIQLYTLREQTAIDFAGVLRRVAASGYAGVELAGFGDLSPAELGAVLDETGLRLASAHVNLARDEAFAAELGALRSLGCTDVVVPFLPPDQFADRAAISGAAAKLNRAAEVARAEGVRLGYHNHFWELAEVDGERALTRLFDELSDDVFAEIDMYWAQVGGADPIDVVSGLGAKAVLLHVKDGPADNPESAMTAVGDGVVDIAGVLGAAPHADWHIVELDRCDSDMFAAVERSARFLIDSGLSKGTT